MFQIYLACSVYLWSSLFFNNLLGHCTCTTIILAYKIMCSQELYVPGMQVENKYGDLTILCLVQEFHNT